MSGGNEPLPTTHRWRGSGRQRPSVPALGIVWHERVINAIEGRATTICVPLTGGAPPSGFDTAVAEILRTWWLADPLIEVDASTSIDASVTELDRRPVRWILTITIAEAPFARADHGRLGRDLRRAIATISERRMPRR